MKICLIHQYYKTPKTGGAIRSYYIARHLQNIGHEVTVIAARNNREYSIDTSEGYEVHYLPVYYENHLSFLSRIHAFFLFVWKANKAFKNLAPFDLNYVITTPLTTGLIALRAKRKFGIPYIFEVGDLWPDAPIQLGVLKNSVLKKIAFQWEKHFYSKAQSIIALSPEIKSNIKKKAPSKNVYVITNFADPVLFNPSQKTEALEEKLGVKGKFVVSYLGTVGLANHLEYLLEAAEVMRSENVHFITAGSGARFSLIKDKASKMNNVSFYDHRSKEELQDIMAVTDAVYVSFKNVDILQSGSPNKFFDGLAAGKLIITNFQGWIKDLIEDNKCGFYHSPDKPKQFKAKLSPFLNDDNLLKEFQKRSSQLAEQFTPSKQLSVLSQLLKNQNFKNA